MRSTQPEAPREDLRQRRTKKHLTMALISLMDERPFSEISVVDICEKAMVHRTTFYAHFDDKYALLRYAVTELYRTFTPDPQEESPDANPQAYFMTMFRNALAFMRQHQGMYRSAASSGGMDLQILEDMVAERICEHLSGLSLPKQFCGLSPEVMAHFYAGAIFAIIRWWLENGMPVEDGVLLTHAERLIFHG